MSEMFFPTLWMQLIKALNDRRGSLPTVGLSTATAMLACCWQKKSIC